jgi:CheY-like chemotaxis protein
MGERDGFRSGVRTSSTSSVETTHQAARVVLGRVRLARGASGQRPPLPLRTMRPRGFDVPDLRGLRILTVEDEVELQVEQRLRLESYGAHVGTARSCREARASLTGGDFHLLVTDLGLPDGTGYELARFALGLRAPPTCIALSGRGSQDEVDQARRVGFRLHLRKPCDPGVLARVIEQFRPDLG